MIATAALAAALTVVFSLSPMAAVVNSKDGAVLIETAAAFVSLLIAFIVGGRFLQTGRVGDLVLACALSLLGGTNLVFSAVPAAAETDFNRWSTWAPLAGRLIAAFGFAVAAFAGDRRLRRPREAVLPAIGISTAMIGVVGAVFAFVAP